MTKLKNKHIRGASLIEALIATAIVAFVVVSILSGVTQTQVTSKNTGDRNIAVMLAELRIEELLKFPSNQLAEERWTDIIVVKDNGFELFDIGSDPGVERQMRRTTDISKDLLQQVAFIEVTVEYGSYYEATGSTLKYPASVVFSTRRALR